MSKKRYVVVDGSETWICEELPAQGYGYTVYELGPEVVEPDYGPLVEWVKKHEPWLRAWRRDDPSLADALKAAQIE